MPGLLINKELIIFIKYLVSILSNLLLILAATHNAFKKPLITNGETLIRLFHNAAAELEHGKSKLQTSTSLLLPRTFMETSKTSLKMIHVTFKPLSSEWTCE